MKAIKADKYGGVEVLQVAEVPSPVPGTNQVLVKVHAAAVTATDINFQFGEPFIARLFSGLTKPRGIPGDVFAGVVAEIGSEVTKFRVGDEVFGTTVPKTGTQAEYITIKETGVIALKPQNLSFIQAAAIVDGTLTSNAFLTKIAKVVPGQSILINGASGSVGIAGVVLAKHFGLSVTAVCSTKNVEFVKSLGADKIIDYTQEDFTQLVEKYDFVYDTVWKSSYSKCKQLLKPQGMYMTTGPSADILVAFIQTRFTDQKAVMGATGPFWKQSELEAIRDLAEQGVIMPVIDSVFAMDQVREAYTLVGGGHKVGSVVLEI